jgi:hypothetical protein
MTTSSGNVSGKHFHDREEREQGCVASAVKEQVT